MDTAIQRKNMVESQVRPSDVTDRRIIRAMLDLEREAFVPEAVKPLAYMDGAVPLTTAGAPKRALLPARTLAKLVQAAAIEPDAAVLDVGAGTGYSSALLARLAGRVVALESDAGLAAAAARNLAGIGTVKVVTGELAGGSPQEGPFDAILIAGAIEVTPSDLFDQLKAGGRLVTIVGSGRRGRATLWRRDGTTYGARELFDAAADVLPGFEKAQQFAF